MLKVPFENGNRLGKLMRFYFWFKSHYTCAETEICYRLPAYGSLTNPSDSYVNYPYVNDERILLQLKTLCEHYGEFSIMIS